MQLFNQIKAAENLVYRDDGEVGTRIAHCPTRELADSVAQCNRGVAQGPGHMSGMPLT